MPRSLLRAIAVVSLTGLGLASVAEAQEEGRPDRQVIAVVPYGGASVASHTLLVDTDSNGGYDLRLGYVVGARLQVPLGSRLEVRADVGSAANPVRGYGALYDGVKGTAHFLAFTARAAYHLTPRRSRVLVSAIAGGGFMQHWISSPSPHYFNWPAAVAGVEVAVPFMRQLGLVLGAETLIYNAKFGGNDPVTTGQQDFRFTVGLVAGR